MIKIFSLLLLIIISGCNEQNGNNENIEYKKKESESKVIPNEIDTMINNLSKIECNLEEFDTFQELELDGFSVYKKVKNRFLKAHKKCDSISEMYHYYGKSSAVFSDDRIIAFYIRDSNLKLSNFINLGFPTRSLIGKYPCMFKDKPKTYSITLFNKFSDDLTIHYNDSIVTSIYYQIDESETE